MSRRLHLRRNGATMQYVYVVALRPEVWQSAIFRQHAKQAGVGAPAVYVGSSAHRPACRLAIHRGARCCSCGLTSARVEERARSRFVGTYGVRILPGYGAHGYGSGLEARKAEHDVAARLRAQGYAVFCR
jgi:hypothetical protein